LKAEPLGALLDFAVEAAWLAGRITLRWFQAGVAAERKPDGSPVTPADREAEAFLRERIERFHPRDGLLGEEFGARRPRARRRWILDPIDGTKSFIHGVPLYGTLVGVEHQGRPLLGVIYAPAVDECVYAAVGQGAWYVHAGKPPRPARVSDVPLDQGLFLTSEVANFERIGRRSVYDRIQAAARLTRSWGDAFGYLMVVTGRAEVMIDPVANVWDLAPLLPILEEAGGKFTDWQGRPTIHGGQGIATNGRAFEEVLAIVARCSS